MLYRKELFPVHGPIIKLLKSQFSDASFVILRDTPGQRALQYSHSTDGGFKAKTDPTF